jgi:hypothetical protein
VASASLAFARRMSDRVMNLAVLTERPEGVAKITHSLPGVDVHPLQSPGEQNLLARLAELTIAADVPKHAASRLAGSMSPAKPSFTPTDPLSR